MIMSLLPCVFKSCLLSSMSSGLLVTPGVPVFLTLPCLTLMSSLKTIILSYILVCVFLPFCVHRDRRPDQTVSVVPSPRFVLFIFSSLWLFPCFDPRSKRVRSPFAAQPSHRSREFTATFAAQRSRHSRELTPADIESEAGRRALSQRQAGGH